MASFTLSGTAERYPSGTSVKAYLRANAVPGQAPSGSSVVTATAGSDSVAFTGLAYLTAYVAYALVGGEHRYKQFTTVPDPGVPLSSADLSDSALLARLTDLVPITPLSGSKTWDPPSVANGAFTSTTVTVTGAVVAGGEADVAVASFGIAVAGCFLYAEVVSADTVRVTLYNLSGSLQDIGLAVLLVKVFKQ